MVTNSDQFFNIFFKDAHPCFALLDRDFNFIRVNESYATLRGKPTDFFPGKNHFELYPSDPQQIFVEARESKKPVQIRARPFVCADQQERSESYWNWTVDPALDEAGEVEILVLALHEVTERVHTEQALLKSHKLLSVISKAQEKFIRDAEPGQLFDALLSNFLDLAESEYGFIGEVLRQPDGQPYLKTYALTNIAWNEETRAFYEENAPAGLEYTNLDTLFGAVMRTGEAVIANDPANDPRRGGLPKGHPAMRAFLGMPILSGEKLVGVIGVANRPTGYDDAMVAYLQPLVQTVGQVIDARASEQQERAALDSLAESEDRFRRLSELSLEAVVVHQDGVITDMNHAATNMFGYRHEELLGQSLLVLAAPESHDLIVQKIKELPEDSYEARGMRKDGSTFPGEVNARTIQYGGREARCVAMRDLTERKKIEDELVQHREHLQELVAERTVQLAEQAKLIDELRDSVISTDLEGIVTSWNKGAERLWGYTAEEAIGQSITLIYPPEEHIFLQEQVIVPLKNMGSHQTETRCCDKTGKELRILLSLTLSYDTQGCPQGMLGYAIDITEQKEAEQQLRESESKYRALFELSDDAIMTMNKTGYLDCNQATLDMYGCASKEEFLNIASGGLSPPVQPDGTDSRVAGYKYIEEAYQQGRVCFEWASRHSNGEIFPSEVRLKPIELEGQQVLQCIMRNISARKQVDAAINAAREEAEFANHAKSEFLARMSHELRTPMNAVLGFGQLLQFGDDNLSDEQRQGIAHILSSGKHLLYLIDEVLDIARVDSGNMELSMGPVALQHALDSSLLLIRPLLARYKVTLSEPDDVAFHVLADAQRLKQVLVNVLSNAVKFNHEGGRVAIGTETVQDGYIRISISDTGPGIKPADQAQVFEPFIRVSGSAGLTEGTGIGLTITKRLVELMDGRIGLDSEYGQGTTFWVEFPPADPLK